MGAAQADHAPVALHDPLRVPRHVVGDHRLRLLQVLALGENVGGDQQVDLALGRLVAGPHDRVRREARERRGALVWRRLAADHGDPVAPADSLRKVLVEVADRRRRRSRRRRPSRPATPRAGAPSSSSFGIVALASCDQLVADRRQAVAVGRDRHARTQGRTPRPVALAVAFQSAPRPSSARPASSTSSERRGARSASPASTWPCSQAARKASCAASIRSTVCRQARQQDSKRFSSPDLSSPASWASTLGLLLGEVEGAGPVAGHGQRVDRLGDRLEEAGMRGVEVVAVGAQARLREAHRRPVGERRARVVALDEGAVAANADRVGERVEHLGARLSGSRSLAPAARKSSRIESIPARAEGPVVAGEQHDQVVEVPEAVVDRRRGQQDDLLLGRRRAAAPSPGTRSCPRCAARAPRRRRPGGRSPCGCRGAGAGWRASGTSCSSVASSLKEMTCAESFA